LCTDIGGEVFGVGVVRQFPDLDSAARVAGIYGPLIEKRSGHDRHGADHHSIGNFHAGRDKHAGSDPDLFADDYRRINERHIILAVIMGSGAQKYELGYDRHAVDLNRRKVVNVRTLADGHMTFLPVAGMQAADIALELEGIHWISSNEPVSLNTVGGLEADIPSLAERREKTAALADLAAGGAGGVVLEGLYLVRRREYLVLAKRAEEERAHIVGDRIRLRNIPYPTASPWRRLALGIGKLVRAGMIR